MLSSIVSATGLTKHFNGQVVLNGVDLEIAQGEMVAIIGPSGCGKSTLCRTLVGLEIADSGTMTLDGQTWFSRSDPGSKPQLSGNYKKQRMMLGMVFQHYTLFPQMTVRENVSLAPSKVLRLPRQEVATRTERVLEQVGLGLKGDRYPSQLSGGEKQRAAIARELAMRRRILVFDEATSALDPELVGEVLGVIRALATDGLTMILVTHEMDFARQAASRVIFMDDGYIVETGAPQQFFSDPQTDRAKAFLRRISA